MTLQRVIAEKRAVVFPIAYYDFYRAEGGNGRRLVTFSQDGMLAVQLPAGARSVSITQQITPVSKAGFALSGLAAIATGLCAFALRRGARSRARVPVFAPGVAGMRADLVMAESLEQEQRAAGSLDVNQ